MARALRADGHGIERLDLGGGLGIRYHDEAPLRLDAYAAAVKRAAAGLDCRVLLEPGRALVGEAGIMVTRVLGVKRTASRVFVVVDAAMNDLLRPALYGAYHAVEPVVAPPPGRTLAPVDIVGPVCESGDIFGKDRLLPAVDAGDLLAIRSAGAYGAVMASSYNTWALVPEVLVKGSIFALVRRRPSLDETLALEHIPDWLLEDDAAEPARGVG